MSNYICFLITILDRYSNSLVQCALKVNRDKLTEDCMTYPLEPENHQILHSLLPLHVQSIGPIVKVEELFEISIVKD